MTSKSIQTPNKDIVISWVYTWSRQREMSIHENRVLLRTMEIIGTQMKGKKIKDYMYQVTPTPSTYEVTMPIKDAFFSDMKPSDVKQELENLVQRVFSVEDKKERIWWCCSFIEHPEVHFGEGTFSFGIYKPFAEVLLNFTNGYREFELNKALALPSSYAMRFYMLMSGGGDPHYMTVEDFKEWIGIDPEDYKDKNGKHRIDNLEERVIKPSQKLLDESCPWSFSYEKVKKDKRNSRSAVIGFNFIPKKQFQFRDLDLERKSALSKIPTKRAVKEYLNKWLREGLNWPKKAVDSHRQNFDVAFRVLGYQRTIETMRDLVSRWNDLHVSNPNDYTNQIGWVMGALKKIIVEHDPNAFIKPIVDIPRSKYQDLPDIPY